jgi:ubiquinone/menaquinone biosynthesis C-methylase UbiE
MKKQTFKYREQTQEFYKDVEVARRYDDLFRKSGNGLRGWCARRVAEAERAKIAGFLSQRNALMQIHRILDIPCGTGKLADIVGQYGDEVVCGDISPEMMDLAKLQYSQARPDAQFVEADAAHLSYEDGYFDMVVCLRLLHRVPQDVRILILKELARVSSRDVIFSVAIVDVWQQLRLNIRKLLIRSTPIPCASTKQEVKQAINAAGLRVVSGERVLGVLSAEWVFHTVIDE